jgi:hypothetical protein
MRIFNFGRSGSMRFAFPVAFATAIASGERALGAKMVEFVALAQ